MPPTAVDPERWDETLHHVAEVARTQPAFDVHLRGTGTFQPVSPVVFIGVVAGISSCEGLAARLRSGPLRSESAFPYHPHVTIAHDVDADRLGRAFVEQSGFEARFRVEAFTVYVQERLDGWRAVGEFGLGG